MAKDDAEEATFEPSHQRLQQLRRKGQIPRSQEVGGAITLIAVLGYVIGMHETILEGFRIVLRDSPVFAPIPFEERTLIASTMMLKITLQLVLPPMGIAIFAALAATMIDVGGFLFTMETLTPNFAKFNPATGLKNMFKVRSLINLVKSTLKVIVLFSCLVIVLRSHVNDAMWAPTCGLACVIEVATVVNMYIVVIGVFLLIVFAAADYVVSRWQFKKDNMMTRTEMKREMKESYGDPHVRGQRDAERRRQAEMAGLVGPNAANLWIVGSDGVVGIAYKPEQSGVPIVAAKGTGETARGFLIRAKEKEVAVTEMHQLYELLKTEGKVGQPIPRESFGQIAQALVKAGFSG